MTVAVGLNRVFTVTEYGTREDLDGQTDRLMDELLNLEDENLFDSAVGVELSSATVEVDIVARGETFEDALMKADAAIRSAIHAIGGATPEWHALTVRQNAELVDA